MGPTWALLSVLVAILLTAGVAQASGATLTFGSTLAATPTLDTANGALTHLDPLGTTHVIPPYPHYAEDTAIWNTAQGSGSPAAPAGGQVLAVRIKGCAIEDPLAPVDKAGVQVSQGYPVNMLFFQTLHPAGDGSWRVTATGGGPQYRLPFCTHSLSPTTGAVNTSTVTTLSPVHQCLARGDLVAFHDIGGFIPVGPVPFYPQGVPFEVLAPVPGSDTASYVGLAGRYGPESPRSAGSGFGAERDLELMMQVVEGTGGDAYGLCPGGHANEPGNSNAIACDISQASGGHPLCDPAGRPIVPRPRLSALSVAVGGPEDERTVTASYRDSAPALTTVRLSRLRGRGRRALVVARLRHRDHRGANAVSVTRRLAAGRYRITVQTQYDGRRSKILRRTMRVAAS